jgi:hypothetical protein
LCILARIDRSELQVGFKKVHGKPRYIPVVMQMAGDDQNAGIMTSTMSLSTVSGLSFSEEEFDAIEALFAIEFVFWCVGNTKSEQLLAERRRHSAGSNVSFASSDFRNYLGRAEGWHCTDIRDRVFGALGVFRVWPRPFPFVADYHLSQRDLLVSVTDYCRATDPWKLAISLCSALNLAPEAEAKEVSPIFVTIISRISWVVDEFSCENFDAMADGTSGTDIRFAQLRRRNTADSAQTIFYRPSPACQLLDSDILISIGDAAMVLGIRQTTSENNYACVGFGFDSGIAARGETWLNYEGIRRLLHTVPEVRVRPADVTEKGEDGTPVLWWIELPDSLFWLVCTYESRRRASSFEEQHMSPEIEASGSTGAAILDSSSGGIPSSRADSF